MRITCPHCGERGLEEFLYHGDAAVQRPPVTAPLQAWTDYVYLRDNPSTVHTGLWYHAAGCRTWLAVTRDLHSHEIFEVRLVRELHR